MTHSPSAHAAGLLSAVSMIVPVVATMLYRDVLDWTVLGVVAIMSSPFYFLTRNRISLERDHPGWRRRFTRPLF